MVKAVKRWIRPVALPLLHGWQWVHDYSLGTLRGNPEDRARREILRDGTMILKDIHGVRFVLYPWDGPNVINLFRRPADVGDFKAIPRLVKSGDIAIDVGAHMGIYSVLLSRLCGPAGHVWAFEPVPETYWRLRETLALNRCDNVVPVRVAVYEKNGIAKMNLFDPQFSELNTFGKPTFPVSDGIISPRSSIEVPARTLDEFCDAEKIARINFLKVDVEGFELAVFHGAQRLLDEHRIDYICFEISRAPLRGAGVESHQVFAALEAHGYSSYRLDRATGIFQGPIHDTSEEWTNLYASWGNLAAGGVS